MILSVCQDPDILSVMNIFNKVITIIKIMVPILIVITALISVGKAIAWGEDNDIKNAVQVMIIKFFVGATIWFIPTFVESVMMIVDPQSDYMDCFNKASKENIKKAYLAIAQRAVNDAERTIDPDYYSDAMYAVSRVEDGTAKSNLERRLEVVNATIEKEREEKIRQKEAQRAKEREEAEKKAQAEAALNAQIQSLDVQGSYASSGNAVGQAGVYQNREPDPSAAINYWKNYLNPNDFIYPRDSKTGLPLGAWPKNYGSITTQLTNYKTYSGGFIWPCTPSNSVYYFVYEHNGMDIMAPVGTPVYSPVDGILEYSEWGHTVNRGGDETAYSVSIKLPNAINVQGKSITTVFLTHMSGIRYRCARGSCNRTVRKGELLGFVGNAAGTAQSVGWAPHLHITLYSGSYSNGLYTSRIENLYGIPSHTSHYRIVAGG